MKMLTPNFESGRRGWVILEDSECVHVVPASDIKPHGFPKAGNPIVILADMNCPCKPRIALGGGKNGKFQIDHNSFEEMERQKQVPPDFSNPLNII